MVMEHIEIGPRAEPLPAYCPLGPAQIHLEGVV